MGRKIKRISWWIRRRSHLPVILLGAGVVALLVFNDETSMQKSNELDKQIASLQAQIKTNTDSTKYYREARENLLTNTEDLEHVVREKYGMQRPTEDIYIIK